jgi:hypothetical protein
LKLYVQIQGPRSHRCLSNFNEVPIWIAHVTPQFRCMGFGLSYESRGSRKPKVVARLIAVTRRFRTPAELSLVNWSWGTGHSNSRVLSINA